MPDFRKMIAAACDAVAETLYPTRCAGCELPGSLLCDTCLEQLPRIDQERACPRCGAPWGSLLCTECHAPGSTDHAGRLLPPAFAFDAARCACSYEAGAKRVVGAYKDAGEQRLAQPMAAEMLAAAGSWAAQAQAVVPIPPTPSHLLQRGWDQVEPLARGVAQGLGLPLFHALSSSKAADQRQLGRRERALNRRGSMQLREGALPWPRPVCVLLVDDVLTTVATCSAAATLLKEAGVGRVLVLSFARVW